MNRLIKVASLAVSGLGLMGVGGIAQAGPVFVFTGPTGAQGSSVSSTSGGYAISAGGYNADGSAHNLYYKNSGGDETGLGLDGTSDNELTLTKNGKAAANFVQFDFSQVEKAFSGAQIEVLSLSSTEKFDLFGSNTLGQAGTEIADAVGTSYDGKLFSVPDWGSYKYVSVAVHPDAAHPGDNILVGAIALTSDVVAVPEPGSAALMATGLVVGLGALHARRVRGRRGLES